MYVITVLRTQILLHDVVHQNENITYAQEYTQGSEVNFSEVIYKSVS